jgi:lysophospholipase L1-like esterase
MGSMYGYLTTRGGLPNFARKLATGSVTVGYLGGSLTMMKEGWRPMFHAWLNKAHPRAKPHRQLHVGRGGVGSASGAFFLDQEICGHDPDLVFIEYAINDSYDFLTPPALRLEFIEGIVRSIKARHPACDICFVYMHHILRGPEIARVVDDYERIAEHYGIPSIHAGRYLVDLVARGEWSFRGETSATALLRDECHPLPAGNELLARLMARSVTELIRQPVRSSTELPAPLMPKPFVGGRVIPVTEEMIRGGFEIRQGRVGNIEQEMRWFSLPEGSCLEISADSTVVGLYLVVGPRAGVLRLEQGGRTVERCVFDRWCSYERIATTIFAKSGDDLERCAGVAAIRLTAALPDYSICPKLEIIPPTRTFDVVGLFVV